MAGLSKNGSPDLSIVEIERQMDAMRLEAHRTDAWMTSRARTKMHELEERDVALRDAFQAGYRMGADSITPLLVFMLALVCGLGWLLS